MKARSFDEAIRRGEEEARAYASGTEWVNPYGQRVTTKYLEVCDAFAMVDEPANGREVYSRTEIVRSDASEETIIERLLGPDEPTGSDERRRKFGVG